MPTEGREPERVSENYANCILFGDNLITPVV